MLIASTYFKRASNSIHSRFGSQINPNFYRIDVVLQSPPNSYHISNFWEKTAEAFNVESLVRARFTPVCSIHDIADTLASDILAKFPAASNVRLRFHPDTRTVYKVENLISAQCAFDKSSTPVERPLDKQNDLYEILTEWQLPVSLQSGHKVTLCLTTDERCASTVYDQLSSLKNWSSNPSFNCVHPTFGLHEKVARIAAGELQSGSAEGVALYIARCLFHLSDKQSPCKRIQNVTVKMRSVLALSEQVRSAADKIQEMRQRKNVNDVFTLCSERLARRHYEQSQVRLRSKDFQSGRHRAFLALGSNLGNRVEMIESAVREMGDRGLSVSRTSALYETKPMYLENQESFLNGACEVCSTNISYL